MKFKATLFFVFMLPWVLFSQFSWEKKGVTSGVINDILYDDYSGLYVIATDSGVYASSDTIDWTEWINGLHDLRIVQLDYHLYNGTTPVYLALGLDGVYARTSGDWVFADDQGLVNNIGDVLGYMNAKAVAFYDDGTSLLVYLALEGEGLFYRSFDPTNNTWEASWNLVSNYPYNPYVTSLHGVNGNQRLLAASRNNATWEGTIAYLENGTWYQSSITSGNDYISLAGDQTVLAGTEANGLYYSTDAGISFTPLCNPSQINGPFLDLDWWIDKGVASTGENIYLVDPIFCPSDPFNLYNGFIGYSRAVLRYPGEVEAALIGSLGNGLWYFQLTTAEGEPRGNEGQLGVTTPIKSRAITDIAQSFSSSRPDAPPVIFASSGTAGLYKCLRPDYCVRYFYAPSHVDGVAGTSVALRPDYDEFGPINYAGNPPQTTVGEKTLYLATRNSGLFRSDNGGVSWKKLTNFPLRSNGQEYRMVKVRVSPNSADQTVFVLTKDATLFKSTDGGETWDTGTLIPRPTGVVDMIAYDLEISPGYKEADPASQVLFVATSEGLLKRTWDGNAFSWTLVFTIFPVLDVALAPYMGLPDPVNPLEKDTIILGTDGGGLWSSSDQGASFAQIITGLGLEKSSITALAMHPKSDVANNRLLTYFVAHPFFDTTNPPPPMIYHMSYDEKAATWNVYQTDPGTPDFPNYYIKSLAFSPNFDGVNDKDVYAGHFHDGLWHSLHTPDGSTQFWEVLNGFYNTPQTIYALAQCPNSRIVLAGTQGYGVMISFNNGESFFPWGKGLEYQNIGNDYTLHDVFAVGCSDILDPCTPPNSCPYRRILASAGHCTAFDASGNCTNQDYYGIYWGDFQAVNIQTTWTQATLDGTSFDNHYVPEIRYCSLNDPWLATDNTALSGGILYSNPGLPDDFGKDWHLDTSWIGDVAMDITCPASSSLARSTPHPLPARSNYIWGAKPPGSPAAVEYKTSSTGSWQDCTGDLGSYIDLNTSKLRAILQVSNTETVLVGSSSGDGIYREEAGDGTCGTWIDGNEGLAGTSKKVIAFANVANGILAALEESSKGANDGGVFFSDTEADGYAWVKINQGMNCSSNYELQGGNKVYTGSTCDGVYATTSITYSGTPTAHFVPQVNYKKFPSGTLNVCLNQPIDFLNTTAGRGSSPTWNWDFGDSQTSTSESPRHSYTSSGNYTVQLTAYNGSYSDTYTRTVQVSTDSAMEITDNSVRVSYDKNTSQVYLSWNDLNAGETGYNIWASNDPSQDPTIIYTAGPDETTDVAVNSYSYYRVQPISSACGGGIIGGTW